MPGKRLEALKPSDGSARRQERAASGPFSDFGPPGFGGLRGHNQLPSSM